MARGFQCKQTYLPLVLLVKESRESRKCLDLWIGVQLRNTCLLSSGLDLLLKMPWDCNLPGFKEAFFERWDEHLLLMHEDCSQAWISLTQYDPINTLCIRFGSRIQPRSLMRYASWLQTDFELSLWMLQVSCFVKWHYKCWTCCMPCSGRWPQLFPEAASFLCNCPE